MQPALPGAALDSAQDGISPHHPQTCRCGHLADVSLVIPGILFEFAFLGGKALRGD